VALGYSFVLDLASRANPLPITPDLFLKLHGDSFGHIYDWAGKWRAIDLDWPPDVSTPWRISTDIRNLCDDLAERLGHLPAPGDPTHRSAIVELVAWFQHRVVKIHPFRDFNGRVARMLSSYLLLQLGWPALELDADKPGAGRERYIAAMHAADGYDLSPLAALIDDALEDALGAPTEAGQ
jgi:cell filamentation protein